MPHRTVAFSTQLILFLLSLISASADDSIFNHVFGVTDEAPIASAFTRNEDGKLALRNLLNYYQDMEITMKKSEDLHLESSDHPPDFVAKLLDHYRWPPLSEETQRVFLPYMKGKAKFDQFKATERVVFQNIREFGTAVEETGPTIRQQLTNLQVEKFYGKGFLTHASDIYICNMLTNAAFRKNGQWFVNAVLTTDEPTIFKAEGQRKYVGEYLNFDKSGNVKSVPVFLNMTFNPSTAKYWSGSAIENNGNRTPVSTTMAVWGGKPGVNEFEDGNFEDNIAYEAALHNSKDLIRQSLDSRTASNTAILMLPIFMATLPIALFADVETMVTLTYMIITDVLTVLPLAIKGIELIVAGEAEYFATRTATYGNMAKQGTIAAETWSVKCRCAQNLTAHGIAFLTIALVSMAAGVVLEFWARRKVLKLKTPPPVNNEYYWTRNPPCAECRCGEVQRDRTNRTIGDGLLGRMRTRNITSAWELQLAQEHRLL